MLVVSRRVGEKILIGKDIEIIVVEIKSGGVVRLGVSAPRILEVDREEVRRRKEISRACNNKSRGSAAPKAEHGITSNESDTHVDPGLGD